jgi:hypothetical protein
MNEETIERLAQMVFYNKVEPYLDEGRSLTLCLTCMGIRSNFQEVMAVVEKKWGKPLNLTWDATREGKVHISAR